MRVVAPDVRSTPPQQTRCGFKQLETISASETKMMVLSHRKALSAPLSNELDLFMKKLFIAAALKYVPRPGSV